MPDGYEVSRDESAWQDLDEFLCEYVDGSMDPVVREVFEEYVLQNPDLARHVECLCQARRILSAASCPCRLRADFVERVRRRVMEEAARRREVVMPGMYAGLSHLTAFTSALVVMTVVGMMVATLLEDPERQSRHLAVTPSADRSMVWVAAYSGLFVPPNVRALKLGSDEKTTPAVPHRLPLVPLWADAEWNAPRPVAASAW